MSADNNYLITTLTKEIEFTPGLLSKVKSMGYTSDNIEDLIIEIIQKQSSGVEAQLQALQDQVNKIGTANLPANSRTFGLKTGSVDAAKLDNRAVQYTLAEDKLEYDFTQIVGNLPIDMSYLGSRVSITANDGKKTSIKGAKNIVTVPGLPATVTLELDIKSANGNLTLEKSVYLEGDASASAMLNVRDYTTAPADVTQQGLNEIFAAEIMLLKQK